MLVCAMYICQIYRKKNQIEKNVIEENIIKYIMNLFRLKKDKGFKDKIIGDKRTLFESDEED